MHSSVRHWRARFWIFGVIVAAMIVYAVAPMPFKKPYIEPGFALLLIVLFGLPAVVLYIEGSLASRNSERDRALAIVGETGKMPLARAQPERAPADALTSEPLELRWKGGVLSATDKGLLLRRPRKADVSLAWADIRLFELYLTREQALFTPGYCVYGSDGRFIEWPGLLAPIRPTRNPSEEAFRGRVRTLLALVTARTSLPLRTVDLSLTTTAGPEHVGSRVYRALKVYYLLLATATLLLAGILSLTMPLTRTLAFNVYVAAMGLAYGAYLLRLMVRAFHEFTRSASPPPPTPLPSPPASIQPTTPVRLKLARGPKNPLRSLLLGVLFLGMLIPLWFSRFDFPRSYYADESITNLYGDLRFVVFLAGMLLGIQYIEPVIMGFLSWPLYLMADENGLSQGRGKVRPFIPWHEMDVLAARKSSARFESFRAIGNGVAIEWTADDKWAEPPAGALPDAGDAGAQFAAIVAQRSGVQPTERWE